MYLLSNYQFNFTLMTAHIRKTLFIRQMSGLTYQT